MKKIYYLLPLFLVFKVAYAVDITCSINSCTSTPNTSIINQTPGFLEVDLNNEDSTINLTNESISSKNLITNPKNLTIKQDFNNNNQSGTHSYISNYLNSLSVTSNALSSQSGKNSSKLCAESFLNKTYGQDAYDYFLSRHTTSDVCDSTDLIFLKNNKFSCDIGSTESATANLPVSINNEKKVCQTNITQNLCAKKSYDVSCSDDFSYEYCCNYQGNRDFSIISDHTFPLSFYSSSCDSSRCINGKSGIYRNRTVKHYGESNKDLSCTSTTSNELSLALSGGVLTRSIDVSSSVTRNGLDISSGLILKDSLGTQISSANYRLFISNVSEIKNSSLSIANCLGLNGSSENDYLCDVLPGDSFVLKVRAIDSSKRLSNEFSISISGNIYITKTTTKVYRYSYFVAVYTEKYCRGTSIVGIPYDCDIQYDYYVTNKIDTIVFYQLSNGKNVAPVVKDSSTDYQFLYSEYVTWSSGIGSPPASDYTLLSVAGSRFKYNKINSTIDMNNASGATYTQKSYTDGSLNSYDYYYYNGYQMVDSTYANGTSWYITTSMPYAMDSSYAFTMPSSNQTYACTFVCLQTTNTFFQDSSNVNKYLFTYNSFVMGYPPKEWAFPMTISYKYYGSNYQTTVSEPNTPYSTTVSTVKSYVGIDGF